MIDAQPGQKAFRIGRRSAMGTYYREIEVVKVTPKQIVATTKDRRGEYRFWRESGREVGRWEIGYFHFSLPQSGDTYLEAGCDRGKEWTDAN